MNKQLKTTSLLATALVMGAASVSASPIVIDDFAGGPHLVNLTSFAPPEMASGTFLHGGAVGGVRDVFVQSQSVGIFSSGVAFGSGGYASFSGNGQGGLIWDGSSAAAVDGNSNGFIEPGDFEYGLNLNLVADCPAPLIHLQAFADLPGAGALLFVGNSATDYAIYEISLTTVGAFDDYYVNLFSPTVTVGAFDPTSVRTIAMLIDGTALDDVDVRASFLGVECDTQVPEAASSCLLLGLGLTGLGIVRRMVRR